MESWDINFQYFVLIFARVLGLLFSAPILSTESLGNRVRVTLALFLAIILFPVTVNYMPALPKGILSYSLVALGQVGIGIIIGFFITVIQSSFQIIGEVLSMQMGISFSTVLDPQSQLSLPLLGTLKNAIGILIFLGVPFQMDGLVLPAFLHMIRAIGFSFQFIPEIVPDIQTTGGLLNFIDEAFGIMFITALKIGIPMIGILFISSLTLGLLGRAAPQMNLINMGIQINIIVGLIVLLTLIPVITPLMIDTFSVLFERMAAMMQQWPRNISLNQ